MIPKFGAWRSVLTDACWPPAVGTTPCGFGTRKPAPAPRIFHVPGSVFHVAFSSDSRQLAAALLTAERGATVIAWDPLTGQELFTIHKKEKTFPFCVTFDPTGRYVLREGPNFSIRVWDARTHEDAGIVGQP